MGRFDVPQSQVENHQTDPAPSSALLDAKALVVEEVPDHESPSDISEGDHEGAERTRPNVHELSLQGPYL